MKDYPLVKLDSETIINLNQIVDVDYTPEFDGMDEEEGRHVHRKSKLVITLTSVHPEPYFMFKDRVAGVASKSEQMILHGDKADRVWSYLSDCSYVLV